MTRRDRIAVADGKRQGIRCDDPAAFNDTKRAFGCHTAFYIRTRAQCLDSYRDYFFERLVGFAEGPYAHPTGGYALVTH